MKQYLQGAVCGTLVLLSASTALAEDVNQIFTKVQQLVAAENFPKALEELTWAQKEIEKQHYTKLETLLPTTLGDFQGQKGTSQSAMGISTVEKKYSKAGDKGQIKLTLSGGSSGAQTGLAALGRMAAVMGGNQPGSESFRINGRTATLTFNESSNNAEVTVFLDSGGMMQLEMRNAPSGEALKTLAESIDLEKLDTYLSGKQG